MFASLFVRVFFVFWRESVRFYILCFIVLIYIKIMAQTSIASYFNTRKRPAVDDKILKAKKVLVLDSNNTREKCEDKQGLESDTMILFAQNSGSYKTEPKIVPCKPASLKTESDKSQTNVSKKVAKAAPKKLRAGPNQSDIQLLLNNMVAKTIVPEKQDSSTLSEKTDVPVATPDSIVTARHVTPPSSPTKITNRLDKVKDGKELTLKEIQQKLSRSHRLAELKKSIAKFKESAAELEVAEARTAKVAESPTLKSFKKLEFEVDLSPQKTHSPEKAYLSPKKDSLVRKNLFSPKKSASGIPLSPRKDVLITTKASLTLPFKYRSLAEVFRCIDTVCQILYNRKEAITFRKLKPAVEEMLKKNLTEKHLGQIKSIFEDAFKFSQEKLRVFGAGVKKEQWELVVTPNVNQDLLTSEFLLERRRKFYNILIDKLKDYHNEFLLTLDPPVQVDKSKVTRWHPEFNLEKVPDIEALPLPQPPDEIKMTSGQEVLEKARQMFNCNTRMEEALARLEQRKKEAAQQTEEEKPKQIQSVLKGIPKALLEKVRQKQAAKALMTITISSDKEKEIQMYSRLPEIARVTRNIFVAEKKGVLPLGVVIDKLENSFRSHLTRDEMEEHLQMISKETPGWLVFHDVRHTKYIKLSKNADVSLVIKKLNKLVEEKSEV